MQSVNLNSWCTEALKECHDQFIEVRLKWKFLPELISGFPHARLPRHLYTKLDSKEMQIVNLFDCLFRAQNINTPIEGIPLMSNESLKPRNVESINFNSIRMPFVCSAKQNWNGKLKRETEDFALLTPLSHESLPETNWERENIKRTRSPLVSIKIESNEKSIRHRIIWKVRVNDEMRVNKAVASQIHTNDDLPLRVCFKGQGDATRKAQLKFQLF